MNIFLKFAKLFLMLTVLTLPLSACAGMEERVSAKGMESTVSIQILNWGGWSTIGSGVVVKQETPLLKKKEYAVLTAEHVANASLWADMRACSAVDPDFCVSLREYTSESIRGTGTDWALFPIETKPRVMRPAKIAKKVPDYGEEIVIIGFPHRQLFVSSGIVGGFTEDRNGNLCILGDAFGNPGNSGGPVFDKRGRVIGLLVAGTVVISPVNLLPHVLEDQVWIVPITSVG